MKINNIHARVILDSRGNPTVECDVILDDGTLGRAAVPSGASTGEKEALELRDNDTTRFHGKGVSKAVSNVNTVIKEAVSGLDSYNQRLIDETMLRLDGTDTKSNLGANAILAVSLANAHAAAKSLGIPLFKHFHEISKTQEPLTLPLPMMNIINGGRHAGFSTDIQEYMIMPVGAKTFSDALRMGSEIFHSLKDVLKERGYATTVGDEGGFAPLVEKGNEEPLELITQAIEKSNYVVGKDILFATDIAASEFYDKEKQRYILKAEHKEFTQDEMIDWLYELVNKYPFASVEDGLDENDWDGWQKLNARIGSKVQLVGDDLLVTNPKFLNRAIDEKSANSILIKLNQIGTVTETIDTVKMAKDAGWTTVISHRSGETEDTTIADFAVGIASGQIKTGSLSRTDRVAKYNQLLRIEEMLTNPVFAGRAALKY